MNNIAGGLSTEAKTNMLANLQIELDARIEKLRAQCDAQCASMQARLERRVNRIPVVTRQTTLVNLLKAAAPVQPVTAPVPSAKTTTTVATTTKTTAITTTKKPIGTGTAARKTRNAAPSNVSATSARPTSSQEERVKPTTKPTTTKTTPAYAKPTKTARAKKRSSDELSGEDKENSELPVPKKRTRTTAQKPATEKPEKAEKPATTNNTRPTRAGSRTKPATAGHVLSPKNNAANARKPAARSVRPR
jgi:hypothetical protein